MIAAILAAGAVCILTAALIKDLRETTRGLVCWTLSMLASVISSVIFFASAGSFSPDLRTFGTGLMALGAVIAVIFLIELFAPSKRLRRHGKGEYDDLEAERSLNVVFVIIVSALTAFVCAAELLRITYLIGLCLIPASAVSARQLSYFLYLARTETNREPTEKQRREEAVKRLKTGNRGL